jgi:hypothetical protein
MGGRIKAITILEHINAQIYICNIYITLTALAVFVSTVDKIENIPT